MSILETDDPGDLTAFQRRGRTVARHVKLLLGWIGRLGGEPSVAIGDFRTDGASLAARRRLLGESEDAVLGQIGALLPRLAEDDLHAELIKIRDLYLSTRELR